MERKCKIPVTGIIFNPRTALWEVYGPEHIKRGWRRTPIFTAASFHTAVTYAREAEGWQ